MSELQDTLEVLQEELTSTNTTLKELNEERDNLDIEDHFDEDSFDEMLDEVYEDCEVAGMTFSTSKALKVLDPTAYRCGYSDFLSEQDIKDTNEYKELTYKIEETESDIEQIEGEIEEVED